eukprot:scaffold1062_cov130-Cylindrotheca_fusiformis.AAC.42
MGIVVMLFVRDSPTAFVDVSLVMIHSSSLNLSYFNVGELHVEPLNASWHNIRVSKRPNRIQIVRREKVPKFPKNGKRTAT